ncbi:MAG: HIT domain-containing protein [Anaerolineae bacterium]|nr:HIT domain-containing protein [Anaerolineae bacterium]
MDHLWTPWRMEYLRGERPPGCALCNALAEPCEDLSLVAHRGEHAFVVMNRYPYNNGHVMVVPNRHVSTLELLDDEELLSVMKLANLSVAALRNLAAPDGFNIGVNLGSAAGAGIEAHCHVHVVPRWAGDTSFMPVLAQTRVIPESLSDTRRKLAESIHGLLTAGG